MQLPNSYTPVPKCLAASTFTIGALRDYPAIFRATPEVAAKLESIANGIEPAATGLSTAQANYRAGVLAIIPRRVAVKLADLRSADVVRSVKRAAEDAGAAIADAVFPGGISPIIKPFGQTEVDGLRALEGRIAAASGWPARDAELARVVEVRTLYETALRNRKEAMLAAAALRALRDAAKEDFLDVFVAAAAEVKATFTRDRPRQDVFFDTIRSRPARDDEDDDDDADDEDPNSGS